MNVTFTREYFALQILAEHCFQKGLNLSSITSPLVLIRSFKIIIHYGGQAEEYLEPSRKSTTELFAKMVNVLKLLTIFAKIYIVYLRLSSKHAFGK